MNETETQATHQTTQAEVDALVQAAAVMRREFPGSAMPEALEAHAADLRVRLLGQERLLADVKAAPSLCLVHALVAGRDLYCAREKGHGGMHAFQSKAYEHQEEILEDTDGTRTDSGADLRHGSGAVPRVDDPARAPSLDALMSRAFGGLSDTYIEFAMALEMMATLAPSFKALGERLREEARA